MHQRPKLRLLLHPVQLRQCQSHQSEKSLHCWYRSWSCWNWKNHRNCCWKNHHCCVGRTAVATCCGSCSFACCSGLARISSCTIRICVLRCLSGRCRISSCRTAASFNTADIEVYNQGVAFTQAACTRQILVDIIFMRTGTPVVQNAVTQALAVISSSQRSSRFPHCNCSGRTICMLNFNRIDLDLCCAVLKRIAAFFYK